MDITTARLIDAAARRAAGRLSGTLNFTPAQRAEWDEARNFLRNWRMENEPGYARQYHEIYHRAARELNISPKETIL